jgi:mRNA interferase HigB
VRIISKARVRQFWESRTEDAERAQRDLSQRDLSAWYKVAKQAEWANFGALKQTFGSADQVGNCVVFDVGNNRYRLIGRVRYSRAHAEGGVVGGGIVYVLKVMDHKEYDKQRWPDECGCHNPPPEQPREVKKPPPKKASQPRERKKRR